MMTQAHFHVPEDILADINQKLAKASEEYWNRNSDEEPMSASAPRYTFTWALGMRFLEIEVLGQRWEYDLPG